MDPNHFAMKRAAQKDSTYMLIDFDVFSEILGGVDVLITLWTA
jgi:hypothetical protein